MANVNLMCKQKRRLIWLKKTVPHWKEAQVCFKAAKKDLANPSTDKSLIPELERLVNEIKWFLEPDLTNPKSPNISKVERIDLILINFINDYRTIQNIKPLFSTFFEDEFGRGTMAFDLV